MEDRTATHEMQKFETPMARVRFEASTDWRTAHCSWIRPQFTPPAGRSSSSGHVMAQKRKERERGREREREGERGREKERKSALARAARACSISLT